MRVLTGIDIIEVDRIKKAICENEEHFLNRIYTKKEIEYCSSKGKMKYQHFAVRFCAKEAVFKALSNEISSREDMLWKEIEVLNEEGGRPKINLDLLKGHGLEKLQSIDISLSHIKEYAIASVTAIISD